MAYQILFRPSQYFKHEFNEGQLVLVKCSTIVITNPSLRPPNKSITTRDSNWIAEFVDFFRPEPYFYRYHSSQGINVLVR